MVCYKIGRWLTTLASVVLLGLGLIVFGTVTAFAILCQKVDKFLDECAELLPTVTKEMEKSSIIPFVPPVVVEPLFLKNIDETPDTKKLWSTLCSTSPQASKLHMVKAIITQYQIMEQELIALKAIKMDDIRRELSARKADAGEEDVDASRWRSFLKFWHCYMHTDMPVKEKWFGELTSDMWVMDDDPDMWVKIIDKFTEEQ